MVVLSIIDPSIGITNRRVKVEQNSKKMTEENSRKLTFVVIFLSLFVFALFGFAPLV